jgi:hypothetical protein
MAPDPEPVIYFIKDERRIVPDAADRSSKAGCQQGAEQSNARTPDRAYSRVSGNQPVHLAFMVKVLILCAKEFLP